LILVLGAHRAGTSAMTRVVNLLGARLPPDLLPAGPGNEAGFWESRAIGRLHEAALAAAGTRWWRLNPIPPAFFRGAVARDAASDIVRFIECRFGDAPLLVIKDPRLSRLLPLWLTALENSDVEPHIVLMLRDPREVASSLMKRDGIKAREAYGLWLRHMLDGALASRALPHCVVTYDDLLADWRRTATRIGLALGLSWPNLADPMAGAAIDAFLSPAHRHHVVTEAMPDRPPILAWANQVWTVLEAAAATGKAADLAVLETVCREFERWRVTPSVVAYLTMQAVERKAAIWTRRMTARLRHPAAKRRDAVVPSWTKLPKPQ
jgi:hypothetical protein